MFFDIGDSSRKAVSEEAPRIPLGVEVMTRVRPFRLCRNVCRHCHKMDCPPHPHVAHTSVGNPRCVAFLWTLSRRSRNRLQHALNGNMDCFPEDMRSFSETSDFEEGVAVQTQTMFHRVATIGGVG